MIYYINENSNYDIPIDRMVINTINDINELYIDYIQQSYIITESAIPEKIKSTLRGIFERLKKFISNIIDKIRQVIIKGRGKALLEKIKNIKKNKSVKESSINESNDESLYIYTERDFKYILSIIDEADDAVQVLCDYIDEDEKRLLDTRQKLKDVDTFISHSANPRTKIGHTDLNELEKLTKSTIDLVDSILGKMNAIKGRIDSDMPQIEYNIKRAQGKDPDLPPTKDSDIILPYLKSCKELSNDLIVLITTITKQSLEMYNHNLQILSKLTLMHVRHGFD